MTANKNYKLDFVERTIEILTEFYPRFEENDREVTFLLNCLLGLIITTTENEKRDREAFRGNIDESFLANIPAKIGFIENTRTHRDLTDIDLTELSVSVHHKNGLLGKDKMWFLMKLRNCIAHQNIDAVNKDGKWIGIRLWNINYSKKDFEVVFSINEIKNFALNLATEYKYNR